MVTRLRKIQGDRLQVTLSSGGGQTETYEDRREALPSGDGPLNEDGLYVISDVDCSDQIFDEMGQGQPVLIDDFEKILTENHLKDLLPLTDEKSCEYSDSYVIRAWYVWAFVWRKVENGIKNGTQKNLHDFGFSKRMDEEVREATGENDQSKAVMQFVSKMRVFTSWQFLERFSVKICEREKKCPEQAKKQLDILYDPKKFFTMWLRQGLFAVKRKRFIQSFKIGEKNTKARIAFWKDVLAREDEDEDFLRDMFYRLGSLTDQDRDKCLRGDSITVTGRVTIYDDGGTTEETAFEKMSQEIDERAVIVREELALKRMFFLRLIEQVKRKKDVTLSRKLLYRKAFKRCPNLKKKFLAILKKHAEKDEYFLRIIMWYMGNLSDKEQREFLALIKTKKYLIGIAERIFSIE